ncbi:MAG: multidrug efflux SMR transporter [bacterium]
MEDIADNLWSGGLTIFTMARIIKTNINLVISMAWIYLAIGIVFEVLGTICMKYAEGFSKLVPSILVFVFYGLSLASLVFVLEKMKVSVAYAIWASLGTALIAIIGMIWFHEPVSVIKIVSLFLIILGIAGLELYG